MAKAAQNKNRAISKRASDDIAFAIKAILEPLFGATVYGATGSGMVSSFSPWKMSDMPDAEKNAIFDKIVAAVSNKTIETVTPNSLMTMIAEQPSSDGWTLDLSVAAMRDPKNAEFMELVNNVSAALMAKIKEVRKDEPLTAPVNSGHSNQPQASRPNCLEQAAAKLVASGYLASTFQYNAAHPWSPEFDKGFRDYIEAASGGKAPLATKPSMTWAEAAPLINQTPDPAGACNAINSTELTAPIKTAPDGTAATNGAVAPAAASPEAAPTKQDILPYILSVMSNRKLAGTLGIDLVAEVRRASILVEAAGSPEEAAKVLYSKTPGLVEALAPVTLEGPITTEWTRRNKTVLQTVVGAINSLVSSAFGQFAGMSLIGPGRNKAVAKLADFIRQASQNVQWTKLASQRKDRIRSQVATEMTVQDRITARRIKARETV